MGESSANLNCFVESGVVDPEKSGWILLNLEDVGLGAHGRTCNSIAGNEDNSDIMAVLT